MRTIIKVLAILGIGFTGLFLAMLPTQATTSFYLSDDAVDVTDGVIETAWGDPIIEDTADLSGDLYCWSISEQAWAIITSEEAELCDGYIYNELAQIDLLTAYFHVNEQNMLLAFTTAEPMFSVHNVADNVAVAVYDPSLSEAGLTALPAPFDHDMIFSFDTDLDEIYDWYVVANIQFDISPMGPQAEENEFLQIFQEEGTTNGFQNAEDTLVSSLDDSYSESTDMESMSTPSETMEIKQNIENFYAVTGISLEDEVNFRLETASITGDVTDATRVTFSQIPAPQKPKVLLFPTRTSNKVIVRTRLKNASERPTSMKVQVTQRNKKKWAKKKSQTISSSSTKTKWNTTFKNLKTGTKYKARATFCNTGGCSPWKITLFRTKF